MNQTQTGHQDGVAVVGEEVTREPERCPADLVDLVVGSELTAHDLHLPITDATRTPSAVGVAHCGKFFLGGATKAGLLANFTERALECGLAPSPSAFGQRPVLPVRTMDHQHLMMQSV